MSLAAVRALHQNDGGTCTHCLDEWGGVNVQWPCATVLACDFGESA